MPGIFCRIPGRRIVVCMTAACGSSLPHRRPVMRFMILVKANADTEAGILPDDALFAEMAAYHEELAKAGALLDASGLQPSSAGWRICYADGKRTVVDGPFTECRELIAGYTERQARPRHDALECPPRLPAPMRRGATTEVALRPLNDLDDLAAGRPSAARPPAHPPYPSIQSVERTIMHNQIFVNLAV